MEYQVVRVSGFLKLDDLYNMIEDEVNNEISKGWKPFGSIAILKYPNTGDDYNYDLVEIWQPMIKE